MQAETILYDPSVKNFCVLNATAACIWEALEQPGSEAELRQAVRERFDVGVPDTVDADIKEVLRRLQDLSMIKSA